MEDSKQHEVSALIDTLTSKGGSIKFVDHETHEPNTIQASIVISVLSSGHYKEVLVKSVGLNENKIPYVVVSDINNGKDINNEQTFLANDVMYSHLARITDVILAN